MAVYCRKKLVKFSATTLSVKKCLTDLSASQVARKIDLLIEILTRLPVKSILMFKSVSKQWLTLLSDPHFAYKHFIKNPQLSVAGLFAFRKYTSSNCEFFFLDGRNSLSGSGPDVPLKIFDFDNSLTPEMMILQSCNGLILCQSGRFQGTLNQPNNLNYHIYNPCTKQCKTLSSLPRLPFDFPTYVSVLSVSLAFDPMRSPHYKVVWIWKNLGSSQIHTYSSETDSWRRSDTQFNAPEYIDENAGVFWNGSLNWVTKLADADYSFCFVIDQELTKRVPLPHIPDRSPEKSVYLGICTGNLYCIKSYNEWLSSLDVLEMSTDLSAWKIKYCLNLGHLTVALLDHNNLYYHAVSSHGLRILLVQEEEDHLKLVLHISNRQVVSYNTKEMELKEVHKLGPEFYGDGVIAYPFIESLAHV